jgi:DNA-binding beta-propeller fold protein YncE
MRLLLPTMIVAVLAIAVPDGEEPLRYVGSIELPHVEGRIDHLAFDAVRQRLFVAGLGNNTVEVLDVNSREHLRSLPGFREPQGIAVATDANVIGVANGEGEGIQLLDAEDFHRVRSVVLGDDSDNARYDSDARLLYVGYGSGAVAVVRPDDGKVVGTVKLDGHPESFQLEKASSRLYVNVPTADQIAVIDRNAMKVVTTWPVRAAKANFPMALDEANHRLFIGCRRPAKVLVVDTASGRETGAVDIVGDTDDLFYDPTEQRLYVSGGDGFLDAFQAVPTGGLTRIAHVRTAPGARTSLFVANQNRIYLAVPHRGSQRAEVRLYDAAP